MGSLPGAVVIPKNFGEVMVLYSATDRVEAVVDGAPAAPNGRLFIVEPGKPTRVPYEAGRFILEHLAYTGVVRVNETQTDTGITYDIEGAKAESDDQLRRMDEQRFQAYISHVVEDFLNKKKPAPRTPDAIRHIMERRGYDLKKYGIFPLGEAETQTLESMKQLKVASDEKDAQIAKLQEQLASLATTVANIKGEESGGKKKG